MGRKLFSYFKKNYSWLIILFFWGIYMVFISSNPTSDAYSNAYSSLRGNDLFRPHHLLYNLLGYIVLLPFSSIEPITILQYLNVLFAVGCLVILRILLKRVNNNEMIIATSLLFVGSCFGFQRFAIDNECYIVPLFFSLLVMNYIQSFLRKNKMSKIVLSAFFSAIGCLFHQIVIWVLIASFIVVCFNKKKKYIISFVLISFIIPIIYLFVIYSEIGNINLISIQNFIFSDYKSGLAEMPILKNVILLSAISLIRTFVQVHGYMIDLIKIYPITSIMLIIISLILLYFGVKHYYILKKRELTIFYERRFVRYIWSLLILYFSFSAFSNGNAEFMIIIPFLIIILFAYYYTYSSKFLLFIGSSIFVWNLWFGLFPMAYQKLNTNNDIVSIIETKEDAVYIFKEKNYIENILLYRNGLQYRQKIKLYKLSEISEKDFEYWKDNNYTIYTDCFAGKEALSRSKIANSNNKANQIKDFDSSKFIPKYKFSALGVEKELRIYKKDKK